MAASVGHILTHFQRWTASRLDELSDAVLLERFVQQRDESTFAALVARHGAMVLRSCRRVLGDVHDSEDAFQATFLILARKAHTLRQAGALPGFLYSVARRVALKARTKAESRYSQRPLADELPDERFDPLARLTARELLTVLDEEVARLPQPQRSAVVLCCLEGRTQEEAARLLGWTAGSLKGHLERGRHRLQARLRRRGIALSAALALVAVSRGEAAPPLLLSSTIAAALGHSVHGSASALTHSVLQAMFLNKLAAALTVALMVALAASTTVALVYRSPMGEVPEDQKPASPVAAKQVEARRPRPRTDALGDPLPEHAIARLGTLRFRHGGPIDRLLFTRDGKHLVSKGDDGVRVWDPATGKELRRLTPPPGENWSQAADLTSDGEQLAVIHGSDSAIDFWSIRHGKKIDSFGKGDYSLVCISPDGKWVAVCAKLSGVELWDVARHERTHSWKAHKWQVWSLLFTADSRQLLTSSPEGQVRLWDVATGRQLQEITVANYSMMNLFSRPLSPDGRLLAVIQENETPKQAGSAARPRARISLWDATTGKQLQQLTCPAQEDSSIYVPRFGALTFTADGKRLLTSGPDRFLRVWDPQTGKEVRKVPFDPREASVLALSPDGRTLAAGAYTTIHLVDLPSGKAHEPPEGEVMAHANPYCAVLTPDGRSAVTGSWDNTLLVWDVDSGRIRRQLEKRNGFLSSLQLSRDGKTLLSHDSDNLLSLWDLSRGEKQSQIALSFHVDMSRGKILWPENRSLFLSDAQGVIHHLDAATGKERSHFQGPKWLWGMAYDLDGPSLVGWSGDRKIRAWDATNGRLRQEYSVPSNIKGKIGFFGTKGEHASLFSAALSPEGRLLAMGSSMGQHISKGKEQYALIFKELKTGRDLAHCHPLPSVPELLVFSPDGRMLAWSGSFLDPAVHLLEVASGRERCRLAGHRGRVYVLGFSAKGERLLSASADTSAIVWEIRGTSPRKPTTLADLEALWTDLAGEDAGRAYQAIHQLAAAPEIAIPFLRKHLRSMDAVDAKHLVRLIADLGSDEFVTRQQATEELAKLGEQAVPAYRKALESKPALESRRRLEDLLDKAQSAWWDSSGERLRLLRAIETLELIGTPEAREVLATLAAGAEGARLTEESKAALQRLTRRGGS